MSNDKVITLWKGDALDEDAARILRRPSANLAFPLDVKAKREIKRLIEAFLGRDDALGLAAPQIGVNRKIIVFRNKNFEEKNWSREAGDYDILFNPRITQARGELVSAAEGCLSCPEIRVEIERFSDIKVRALDASGGKINRRYSDFLARIVQHEIDHLEGKLIIDHEGALYCPKNRVSFFEDLLREK